MKWVVATLVFANLMAFYWFSSQPGGQRVEPLSTLSEPDVGLLALVTELPAAPTTPPLEIVPGVADIAAPGHSEFDGPDQCWALGPVIDESVLQRLASEMDEFGYTLTAREAAAEAGVAAGFWVYIAPLETVAALGAKRRQLAAEQIEYFVFHNGNLKNGISLGYFVSEENARARQKVLELRGIKVQVDSSENVVSSYWMLLSTGAFESLSPEFWADMNRLSPDMEVQSVACGGGKGKKVSPEAV